MTQLTELNWNFDREAEEDRQVSQTAPECIVLYFVGALFK